MIKIILIGSEGRMGHHVRSIIEENDNFELVAGFDINEKTGEYNYFSKIEDIDVKADVIIDFSFHTNTKALCDFAIKSQIPLLIATTGQTQEEMEIIKESSKKVAVFKSGNTSVGIACLIDNAKRIASCFPDADIEIIETHHNRKADAPSGTALMIAEGIKSVRPDSYFTFGREGQAKRNKKEIGIHAIRMGNIVGIHEVLITTDNQQISIKHTAFDRKLLAEGGLQIAEYLKGKPQGYYTMDDYMGD